MNKNLIPEFDQDPMKHEAIVIPLRAKPMEKARLENALAKKEKTEIPLFYTKPIFKPKRNDFL